MSTELIEHEVDVADLVRLGQEPGRLHVLLPRGRNESWLVAHEPLDMRVRTRWGPVRDGDHVFVPLIPYRTHCDANKAIKYAITLGLRVGLDVQLPPNQDIRRLYLVTGTVAEDLAEAEGVAALRFHLGLAVQLH